MRGTDMVPTSDISSLNGLTPMSARFSKALVRSVTAIESAAIQRLAAVRANEAVDTEKLNAIDHFTQVAMDGQVFLRARANHLAGDDILMAEELRFFTDSAKLAKGQVIADSVRRLRYL